MCLPGKETAELKIDSGGAGPANEALFDDWIGQLPVDADNVGAVHTRAGKDGACEIGITWQEAAPDSIEFLPGILDNYNIVNTQVKTVSQTTTITFSVQALAGQAPPPVTLQAVVGYMTKDGKHRGVNVSLALGAGSANNH